ncbi:MAG: hypothetical protein P4L48_20820 [Mycobacterium sp.]|nr:hypothetical protein [Mycobacterium sp.]
MGVGLHAIEDFYSHSNWVDDPSRRSSWRSYASPLIAGPGDPREALPLYTGGYEQAPQATFKPHGRFTLDCSLMRTLLPARLDERCLCRNLSAVEHDPVHTLARVPECHSSAP